MSRGTRNNVRGPSSALTEFLREQGITRALIEGRARTRIEAEQQQQTAPQQQDAGPSTTAEAGQSSVQDEAAPEEYNSDNLDNEEEEAEINTRAAKKRKLTKRQEQKLKADEKKKLKKQGGFGSDDSEEDEYTALSRGAERNRQRAGTSDAKPPVGNFETCARCEKQFTVTKYTMAANPGPGWLCHVCAKASGADPFKKPAAPRQRAKPEERRKFISFEEKEFPTLATLCINLISQHINEVEALGNIGFANKTALGRALARNRSLTVENAPLLYDAGNTNLKIFDATKLGPGAFCTLASLNPSLENLHIDFCGRINDSAIEFWASHFPNLKRLELLGPFLVKAEGWKTFFRGNPQLTGFLITQSPRFDLDCINVLSESCPVLTELRLSQVGLMSDEFLEHIKTFENLTSLDLSSPSESLSSHAVCDLLDTIGKTLVSLNLSKNDLLDDAFVERGLLPNVRHLTSLSLDELPEITDTGLASFFAQTPNGPLQRLSLRRNHVLADESLVALLNHSGAMLKELDINSWKGTSNEALMNIGSHAPKLTRIDFGFCRKTDDFVIKSILDGCPDVKEILVFGCNRLTDGCPRKHGVNIRGVETNAI